MTLALTGLTCSSCGWMREIPGVFCFELAEVSNAVYSRAKLGYRAFLYYTVSVLYFEA